MEGEDTFSCCALTGVHSWSQTISWGSARREPLQLKACRPDAELAAQLETAHPTEYALRKEALEQEAKEQEESGIHHLVLRVGNRHSVLPDVRGRTSGLT